MDFSPFSKGKTKRGCNFKFRGKSFSEHNIAVSLCRGITNLFSLRFVFREKQRDEHNIFNVDCLLGFASSHSTYLVTQRCC